MMMNKVMVNDDAMPLGTSCSSDGMNAFSC